jgi:site-specific DNA-cytosine methylase
MKSNYVDNTITTIEMCAGYGGIGLGLKNIFGERLRTIAYCELEGYAQANLISKMEKGLLDAAPIWNDLKTFPYKSFYGLVDILIAGYPCQPFSAAGKRAGKDDPRHLWPWIADGIQLLRPRMCFFENVEGHISLGLSTVISDLEELGYKVAAGLFSAAECLDASGRTAPHQRKRIFIMAHRSGERLQGGKWCWKTRAQGESSGHFAECGSSMADSIMRGMSRSRNELGDSCEAGQGGKNPSQNSNDGNKEFIANSTNWRGKGVHDWNTKSEDVVSCRAWPSRPGQQQYAWEPPRVVADARCGKHGWREIGERPIGGASCELGEANEAFGNAECIRIPTTREHGAMDEASGIPTDREGCESAQTDSESSAARKREGHGANASECHEIESSMGDPIDGTSSWMGDSKLSTLCDSELAEIREWMVKCDNRTDELRLLGNGVVPATAEKAFLTLIEEINK